MSTQFQIVHRVFSIMNVLAVSSESITLADITERSAIPKSTVHRILSWLVSEGYVLQHRHGYYGIGHAQICLSARSLRGGLLSHLIEEAKLLRNATGHTVYITTVQNMDNIYLGKESGIVAPYSSIGHSGNALCSGSGKAILATLPFDETLQLVKKFGFRPRTEHSIKDFFSLKHDMLTIRERGFSLVHDEFTIGVSSIGAPIYDHTKNCSLSISLIVIRGTSTKPIEEYGIQLVEAANKCSRQLGHIPPYPDEFSPYSGMIQNENLHIEEQ